MIFRHSRVNPEFAEGGWAKIRDAIYEGRRHDRARQQPPRRVSPARSAPAPSGSSGVGPRIDGAQLHPLPEDRDFHGGQLLLGPHRQIFIRGAHGFDQQAPFHSPGTMTEVAGRKSPKMGGLNRVVSEGRDRLRTSKKMFFFRSTRRLRWSVTGDFQTAGPWWCCHRHFQATRLRSERPAWPGVVSAANGHPPEGPKNGWYRNDRFRALAQWDKILWTFPSFQREPRRVDDVARLTRETRVYGLLEIQGRSIAGALWAQPRTGRNLIRGVQHGVK